jgi:hypothetical protein
MSVDLNARKSGVTGAAPEQVLQEAASLQKRSLLQTDPTCTLPVDALQPLLLLLDRIRLATVRTVEVKQCS